MTKLCNGENIVGGKKIHDSLIPVFYLYHLRPKLCLVHNTNCINVYFCFYFILYISLLKERQVMVQVPARAPRQGKDKKLRRIHSSLPDRWLEAFC